MRISECNDDEGREGEEGQSEDREGEDEAGGEKAVLASLVRAAAEALEEEDRDDIRGELGDAESDRQNDAEEIAEDDADRIAAIIGRACEGEEEELQRAESVQDEEDEGDHEEDESRDLGGGLITSFGNGRRARFARDGCFFLQFVCCHSRLPLFQYVDILSNFTRKGNSIVENRDLSGKWVAGANSLLTKNKKYRNMGSFSLVVEY